MDVKVHCYSGYRYPEEPRPFVWEESELRIKSIENAWQEPAKRLFKVVTRERRLFVLCYNETTDRRSVIELVRF